MRKGWLRAVSLIMAAIFVFGILPPLAVPAQAQESVTTLDSIAWEDLTYRDIFITNNKAYLNGFNDKTFSPFLQNTGTNTVTTDACYTGPYSLAAFGTPSQQIKSVDSMPAGDYFVASKVYCTRYSAGELGVCLYHTTVGVTEVTDGFVTAAGIISLGTSGRIFIGSIHSADLDGYVDDPVVVDMSIFATRPTEAELTALYETYVDLEKAIDREEIPYTDQECLDAFVLYMNEKAAQIGMHSSKFNDPVGLDNLTTASDLLRLMVYAYSNYPQLHNIWGTAQYTVTVSGDNARQQTVESTVIKPELEDYYHILGGKTGTLTNFNARNLAVILEIPDSDDVLAVVAMYADGKDTAANNRYEAVRQIADAALQKYSDPTVDTSTIDVCCAGAMACLIPADGADMTDLQILYEKDTQTQRVPASITKVLTAICALDCLNGLDTSLTYANFDTQIGTYYSKDFLPGDSLTLEDALYAMLLPSSNVTARMVSRLSGEAILGDRCRIYGHDYDADSVCTVCAHGLLTPLSTRIPVTPGQLTADGEIVDNEIYGYIVNYELKKGHTLSISNTDYVFSVRKYDGTDYSTMLKEATVDSYTAAKDMTVGCLIRKPDKSALTEEELAAITLYDTQYGMKDVPGYSHRFTVEAETIDGGTATTRAAIFLPPSYDENGSPTPWIIMTNGLHGHLSDTAWNANTDDDVAVMKHYMEAGYAVLVVDNTAKRTSSTTDLGNPQLISSYWKAYDYVQAHFCVEELFSLHSRSQGTFAAMRIMREHPELVKCALMCGAVTSLKSRFAQNPAFIAGRFGFDDTTGATYEADKVVGYDPYTDVDGVEYDLPSTFWMMAEADANTGNLSVIDKIEAHGNDVTTAIYTDTDHSGVCRLNTDQCWADALAFLESHQESTAEHRFCAWETVTPATCQADGEMRRECADCDYCETMTLPRLDGHIFGDSSVCAACGYIRMDALSQTIELIPGQFDNTTGEWVSSSVYGHAIGYELKKGHTLSISDPDYVFVVRKLVNGVYSTIVRDASSASFTATEDMTVAIRVRKPDKSALTAEELASVVLYDSQYGMIGVEGYGQRFTVEAETIDGGTATTRAAIFLPESYSATGDPTRLIVMTNGHSAYLADSTWNGNTAENVGIIRNYLNAGYAVWVVNNTKNHTGKTPDLGCPQLVSSYFEAYEYIQKNFNVEEKFSIHSRSFGTFAAVRIMLERPELVKCAVMTGPRVSIQKEWPGLDKAFIAQRFGFADTTGKTYEADIMVGHDPYTDVNGEDYALPPTFWMLAEGDATARPLEYIEKLTGHGNNVTSKTYSDISHTGICTLNTDETFADALAFLERYQDTSGKIYRWEIRDNALVSTGATENVPLLLAGSVTDDTVNAARYQLTESVKLQHDRPWVIQWRCTGDWSGLLLAENTTKEKYLFETSTDTGLLAFGCNYEHYGISLAQLGIDRNVPHTFRLENRVGSDGSNMVYLYVDGEEIGPMNNHYYTGNVNRNETVDWLNGQDFAFCYLGASTNLIHDLKLDYLQILDAGCTHTYKSTYTEPTCTQAGWVTHLCTTCGAFYRDGQEDALGHNYVEGVCTRCLKPESLIGAGWSPVPFSTTQVSDHLAYKIEDGVLTFHDFGDPEAEDYGILPDYTNTNVVETKYNITEWYQSRNGIQKVVFDETIRDIGAYTLTNMDRITEIRIENPNAVLATHLCLFSTENRAEPLRIYAASTVKTVESWIRGNSYRKITAAVTDVVLYFTDLEPMAQQLKELETALETGDDVDPLILWRALRLLEDIPHPNYSISDYRCAIVGAEDILERLWELTSGPCGENLTYHLTAMEQEGKLNLHITGKGAMTQYSDPTQAPWYDVMDCISDITVGDLVTGIHDPILPAGATYHVYLNSEAYTLAREKGYKIQLDTLRILLIGNSHTADYSEFRGNILADLKNAGLETEIVITRTVIGSTGLYSGRISKKDPTYSSHLEYIENNAGAYSNLKNYRYDLIIVQDYMESIIDTPEVFSAGLASFVGAVKAVAAENGQGTPQVAWFADWVDIRTTGGDNALYDGDGNKISLPVRTREEVYAHSLANIARIEAGIAQGAENMPDFVIHGVTIKHNAMSSYLGQSKLFDKNAYCLLERDTTHMTYELGRYLMGAGVFSEILEHYRSVLIMDDPAMTVGSALTLENGPVAAGTGSQYSGAVNAEILQIIREAISSPDVFRQSVYVTDPVDAFLDGLSQVRWDLSGVTDAASALNAATEQISGLGSHLETVTVALAEYVSPTQLQVTVQVSHGYTIRKATVLIHSCQYDSQVTAPTCTQPGYTTHTCSVCGDSYVDSYVDATGEHSYENGLCIGCGVHLPGDINGDGEINNKDVTRLFQYLSDYEVEVTEEALDVNGDGTVNNKDLTRLFQYLSDYEVEIH